MSQYILSADAPRPLRRFTVTVTLPRPDGEDVLMPPGAQAAAERAAAAVAADGLLTAWTSARAVLSMVIEAPCQADALTAGAAVVRALGGERGAAVKAEPGNPWLGSARHRPAWLSFQIFHSRAARPGTRRLAQAGLVTFQEIWVLWPHLHPDRRR